jgi:hypothetical protein
LNWLPAQLRDFLPHDLGTLLAIVALILMYPVSLVANLSTPWIRDWWSARSLASLTERRDKLVAFQEDINDEPTIDEATDAILRALQNLIMAVTHCAHVILAGIWLLIWYQGREWTLQELIFAILIFENVGFGLLLRARVRGYRRRVSPALRELLAEEIAELEAKLTRFELD